MQTSNAAAVAFDFLGQAFEIQLFFLNCSAKVAEEKIRYAAYNCLAIDTDVSPWEEWPSSRDSLIVNRRSHEKKRTISRAVYLRNRTGGKTNDDPVANHNKLWLKWTNQIASKM